VYLAALELASAATGLPVQRWRRDKLLEVEGVEEYRGSYRWKSHFMFDQGRGAPRNQRRRQNLNNSIIQQIMVFQTF
jgi:hypothetical protein